MMRRNPHRYAWGPWASRRWPIAPWQTVPFLGTANVRTRSPIHMWRAQGHQGTAPTSHFRFVYHDYVGHDDAAVARLTPPPAGSRLTRDEVKAHADCQQRDGCATFCVGKCRKASGEGRWGRQEWGDRVVITKHRGEGGFSSWVWQVRVQPKQWPKSPPHVIINNNNQSSLVSAGVMLVWGGSRGTGPACWRPMTCSLARCD